MDTAAEPVAADSDSDDDETDGTTSDTVAESNDTEPVAASDDDDTGSDDTTAPVETDAPTVTEPVVVGSPPTDNEEDDFGGFAELPLPEGTTVEFTVAIAADNEPSTEAKTCSSQGTDHAEGTVATTTTTIGTKTSVKTFQCKNGEWVQIGSTVTTDTGITDDPNDDPFQQDAPEQGEVLGD